MAMFTTRVELHDAVRGEYTTLHERMAGQGFSRTILSDQGVRYQLPTAEYVIKGALTRNDVTERAKAAARSVRPSFEVLVTEADGVMWYGLPKA